MPSKIATLKAGNMPIYEPGLEEMVRRNTHEDRLVFTTDLASSVRASEIVFIAVGTPQGEDGSADLQHVLAVARDVGRAIDKYTVVVDKSTVPGRHGEESPCHDRCRDDAAVQRRQQPGVSEAGRGHRRFHEARSRRDRR